LIIIEKIGSKTSLYGEKFLERGINPLYKNGLLPPLKNTDKKLGIFSGPSG
jgi:hypothetical protein